MGKEDSSTGMAAAAAPSSLTAIDIQQKEFRVSRFGGYRMRDVDEFLDQITDSFAALSAEVERLRAGGSAPVVGSPDLDDVSRQADEIIARARAEAARIAAEARASASPAIAAAPSDAQDRAAVSAFIAREREFLQSLAGLVQEHAETVKGMAKSSRPAPGSAATSPASAAPASPEAATSASTSAPGARMTQAPPAPPVAPSTASPGTETEVADAPAPRPEPTRVPDSEPTVRVDEPATAGATRGDAEPEGDRSLRELFWGED